MKSPKIYTKAYAAIAAGVFAASQAVIVMAAPTALEIEKKEAAAPSAVGGTASEKSTEVKKTMSQIAAPDAKQQRLAVPSKGTPNAIPIVGGPIGPPPKGDGEKPGLNKSVAPGANSKKALTSPATTSLKADKTKTATPSPTLDVQKDIPK